MKNAKSTSISLAVTVCVGFAVSAPVLNAAQQGRNDQRDSQYGGSLDARQHGYEHAYRDGADRGRQDREGKRGNTLKANDYQIGARSYESAFGDRTQYMQGYRDGYKAGYDDGYNGRDGQYGQLYARPRPVSPAPPSDPYADRPYSSTDMAFDAGYREGITLGQQDHTKNSRSNFQDSASYRSADLGYRSSYGDRQEYQRQFRDGVDRGYEDGFGRSRGGVGGGNAYRPSNGNVRPETSTRAQLTQGMLGGTFTVSANRQWTPTGIRVNQGDLLRFTSTGEIHFTGNATDQAGVAGSPNHKFIGSAPLPNALAGALIGRIDNGLPFGIGDQTTITVPGSGLLYLGTNDDNVSDNSGQFKVVISFGR